MAGKQSNNKRSTAKSGKGAAAAEQTSQAPAPEQESPEPEAPATEQDSSGQADQEPEAPAAEQESPEAETEGGEVRLEVSTREVRRIRAGVTVRREPRVVAVTEDQAKRLEADGHIKVKRL